MNKLLKFEIIGTLFICVLGSILHFTFDFSDRNAVVGIFSAVNESTWEHFKLTVIPAALWTGFGLIWFKPKLDNFFTAKAVSIYLMPVLIAVFFYSYEAILGRSELLLDIGIFVISVILGQIVSYKIINWPAGLRTREAISLLLIVVLMAAFAVFTFWTPHNFLFQDPTSGGYGIVVG